MVSVEELAPLLPADVMEKLAVKHRVDARNQVRLQGVTVFICLLNTLLHQSKLTQRLLEETYTNLTGAHADHSSFGKRLAKIPAGFFQALFEHLYQQVQPLLEARQTQALRLRFVDATIVVLSAKLLSFGLHQNSRGRAGPVYPKRLVKSVFELGHEGLPQLLHLCRHKSEADDSLALGAPMKAQATPGDLFIFDRGCDERECLLSLKEKGAHFLTPHDQQKLRRLRVLWQAPDPQPQPQPPKKGEPDCELLLVEEAVFENSRDAHSRPQQEKWAKLPLLVLHARRWDTRKKVWQPLVLLTSLPLSADGQRAGPYTFLELLALYRRRWEIEIFFKFLKQHLSYAHLTSRSENGIQVMISMALCAAVLLIWYKKRTGIDRGWRSVKFWLAEDVRLWTQQSLGTDLRSARLTHSPP